MIEQIKVKTPRNKHQLTTRSSIFDTVTLITNKEIPSNSSEFRSIVRTRSSFKHRICCYDNVIVLQLMLHRETFVFRSGVQNRSQIWTPQIELSFPIVKHTCGYDNKMRHFLACSCCFRRTYAMKQGQKCTSLYLCSSVGVFECFPFK